MKGSGIDIERINRFRFIERRAGRFFYERVFTTAERASYGHALVPLALCFTAKEAVAKTLGAGLDLGSGGAVGCTDIEIICARGIEGPRVGLAGRARARAEASGLFRIALCWREARGLACSLAAGATSETEFEELQRALRRSLRALVARHV